MPRTTKALKRNVESLTSTKRSRKQSTTSSKKRTQTTRDKTTLKTTTTQRAKVGTSKAKSSTAITIIQSRKKDMFPHMGIIHKFPYHFEPMPEIADRLNKAWFDEHFGEERMKDHIRRYKLKSHQYKAYVNYWWLQDKKRRTES